MTPTGASNPQSHVNAQGLFIRSGIGASLIPN